MKKRVYGSIILVLLFAAALFASREDCVRNLQLIAAWAESKGITVNYKDSKWGFLGEGESFTVKTTCYNSVAYAILAAGGSEAQDVDIQVFDENGNLVSEDGDDKNVAIATFAPRWTGTYYFKVKLYSSSAGGDFVGYVRAYVYR